MFTVKSKVDFITDIRAIDKSLSNIRLSSILVNRKEKHIKYQFICDKLIGEELKKQVLKEAEKITSPVFSSVTVSIKKIVCDSELICNAIFKFINANYSSISVFLKTTDVSCVVGENDCRYTIKLSKDNVEYVKKNGVFNKLNEFLSKNFCSEFIGAYEETEQEESVSLLEEEVFLNELEKIERRTIKVKDVVIVDDLHLGDLAIYIEDMETYGNYVVCGTVTEITEKQTSKGKPMFVIHISDTTGNLSGIYFSKKTTVQKIRDITVGESIIARGTLGEYNGKKSFTFEKINRCTFPKGFEKKEKFKKHVPKNYSLIFPEQASTIKLTNVFDSEEVLPNCFFENTYVVFDIETTGLELMSNGITEIGAVKIVNGKITEQWTTLVKPDYKIDKKNVEITGITPEMLVNSPKIEKVLPDFLKFIEGSVLVAHNQEFDMKFIKRFANANDYEVNNQVEDTMVLARKCLTHLKHHDLQTVADQFNVVFHHHRALSDAYATAEIFIKLKKMIECK